ncbi:acetoin utilization protein AcuC, partial [Mycobacterium kansasii]
IVSQCGCDSHASDPLTDLSLTVDGQRAAILAMRDLADEVCDGRWLAVGGGGYQLVHVVPRAWTHLIAAVVGADIDPATPIPAEWK